MSRWTMADLEQVGLDRLVRPMPRKRVRKAQETSEAQSATSTRPVKKSKYGARRTCVDGIWFDSLKESRRYSELKIEQKAGLISDLELQPSFSLHALAPNGQIVEICQYIADFEYRMTATWTRVIEDTKGVRTAVYRLKKRWLEAEYGIQISET